MYSDLLKGKGGQHIYYGPKGGKYLDAEHKRHVGRDDAAPKRRGLRDILRGFRWNAKKDKPSKKSRGMLRSLLTKDFAHSITLATDISLLRKWRDIFASHDEPKKEPKAGGARSPKTETQVSEPKREPKADSKAPEVSVKQMLRIIDKRIGQLEAGKADQKREEASIDVDHGSGSVSATEGDSEAPTSDFHDKEETKHEIPAGWPLTRQAFDTFLALADAAKRGDNLAISRISSEHWNETRDLESELLWSQTHTDQGEVTPDGKKFLGTEEAEDNFETMPEADPDVREQAKSPLHRLSALVGSLRSWWPMSTDVDHAVYHSKKSAVTVLKRGGAYYVEVGPVDDRQQTNVGTIAHFLTSPDGKRSFKTSRQAAKAAIAFMRENDGPKVTPQADWSDIGPREPEKPNMAGYTAVGTSPDGEVSAHVADNEGRNSWAVRFLDTETGMEAHGGTTFLPKGKWSTLERVKDWIRGKLGGLTAEPEDNFDTMPESEPQPEPEPAPEPEDNFEITQEMKARGLSDQQIADGLVTTKDRQVGRPDFLSWFRDSKVIGPDGEPEEQWGAKPIKLFHGTSRGGFEEFDTEKSQAALFGKGFYFTSDKEIAEGYTGKDEDSEDSTEAQIYEVFLSLQNPLDLNRKMTREDFESFAAAGGAPEKEKEDLKGYLENSKNRLSKLKEALALGSNGVKVIRGTYTKDEGVTNYGRAEIDPRDFGYDGGSRFISEYLREKGAFVEYEDRNWNQVDYGVEEGGEIPEGFAVVRSYSVHRGYGENSERFEIHARDELVLDDDYLEVKALRSRKKAIKQALVNQEKVSDVVKQKADGIQSMLEDAEKLLADREERLSGWDDRPPLLYGTHLKGNHLVEEATGKDYAEPLGYDDYVALHKYIRRETKGKTYTPYGGGDPRPIFGAHHVEDHDDLTLMAFHNMMTDSAGGISGSGLAERFTQWAKDQGHDGLKHTGGWNVGTHQHDVWIAFEPNQIKATNAKYFNPDSSNIYNGEPEAPIQGASQLLDEYDDIRDIPRLRADADTIKPVEERGSGGTDKTFIQHPDGGPPPPHRDPAWQPALSEYDEIVINSSGGKDSQAVLHQAVQVAKAQGYPLDKITVVHCDLSSRVEWSGTEDLAREQAEHYGLKFEVVRRPSGDLLDQIGDRYNKQMQRQYDVQKLASAGIETWDQLANSSEEEVAKIIGDSELTDQSAEHRARRLTVSGLGSARAKAEGAEKTRVAHTAKVRAWEKKAAEVEAKNERKKQEHAVKLERWRERAGKAIAAGKAPPKEPELKLTRTPKRPEDKTKAHTLGKDAPVDFGEVIAWPSADARFCTSDHKSSQVQTWIRGRHPANEIPKGEQRKVLQVLGIRREESANRLKYETFDHDKAASTGELSVKAAEREGLDPGDKKRQVDRWHPIIGQTTEQVWDTIKEAGTRHHAAYDMGMKRLSCMFCVFATKDDIKVAAEMNPGPFREYLKMEHAVGSSFSPQYSLQDVAEELEAERVLAIKEGRVVVQTDFTAYKSLIKAVTRLRGRGTHGVDDTGGALSDIDAANIVVAALARLRGEKQRIEKVHLYWRRNGLCVHLETAEKSHHVAHLPYPRAYNDSILIQAVANAYHLTLEESNAPKASAADADTSGLFKALGEFMGLTEGDARYYAVFGER